MKKLLILFLLILTAGFLKAQCPTDTISLNEGNFHVAFSKSLKYPVKVAWHLCKADLSCDHPLKRSNKFVADPQLPETNYKKDYEGSGYDQGHNDNAKDNACQPPNINICCWRYTNMCPQLPELNRFTWRYLEEQCRTWAKEGDDLYIICGSIGKIKSIGPDSIAVPAKCWKYIKHKDGHIDCFIMPNNKEVKEHAFEYYSRTVPELEIETGLRFN